jgi:hypothetical protein
MPVNSHLCVVAVSLVCFHFMSRVLLCVHRVLQYHSVLLSDEDFIKRYKKIKLGNRSFHFYSIQNLLKRKRKRKRKYRYKKLDF